MNKFKMTGLAIIFASGMAFAGGSLWSADAPYGIVQFPWIVDCIDGPNFDETNPDDPCYKDLGGWWFGYVAGPAAVIGESACGGYKSGVNTVTAKINGQSVSFVGPDYSNCEGPAVTDIENGNSLLLGGGLEIRLNIGAGVEGPPKWEPAIAAFAVNLSNPPTTDKDLSSYGGLCLAYESDHTSAHDLALELGWDESDEDDPAWDTWYVPIPVGSGPQVKNFRWQSTSTGGVSGDFMQDGYAKPPRPITAATQHMRAIKIRLKDYVAGTVNFKLIGLGWPDECSANPIISKGVNTNNLNLNLYNRMLSMTVKSPASVQIFNLQGAVVYNKVYVPGSKMNLNNLPTGVYMVRVPDLGYSGKIMLK